MPDTMRAVQFDRAGGLEVLQLRSVPVPTSKADQLLVRVHATSINPADVRFRRIRFGRFPRGTGMDFAGEIVETGRDISDLKPGQLVWGYVFVGMGSIGAAADYVVAKRDQAAAMPASLDFLSAAALPTVGLTALQTLRDALHLRAGQRLLVIGASGGVGSAAVQLGRAMGASVTAVASAGNADFCRELGANEVIDYAKPQSDNDALLDCHGASLRRYHRLLRRGGRGAAVAASALPFALRSWLLPGPRIRIVMVRARRDDLDALAVCVERGQLRPVIEEVFPLAAIQEAHRAVESGHARGKRVIDMSR
jgi:NADPH:quinone reductase-like Zn-dependent oxidoreductase